MKKSAVLTLFVFLCIHTSLFSLEQNIVIGREDNWKDINKNASSNIVLQEGRLGFLDVVLHDGEYRPTGETDMLFHFNRNPLYDETGNYTVDSPSPQITDRMKMYGKGSAVFQRRNAVRITPGKGALFYPGTNWRDFTIEFWLYPANLEEGEVLFFWQGSEQRGRKIITQQVICTVTNRRLTWSFKNFFIPPDKDSYSVELTGAKQLVPRTWKHHLIRFNSETGLLEYVVDSVPEAVAYASRTGREDGSVYLPAVGRFSSEPVQLGVDFTGFMDELRISRTFVNDPFIGRFKKTGGTLVTDLFDLQYSGSSFLSLQPRETTPGDSAVDYYYYISDISMPLTEDDTRWKLFAPGKKLDPPGRGRFLQLMVKLYPDGYGRSSPVLSDLTITYEPDFPPTAPDMLTAIPGNGQVTLHWNEVADTDIAGYKIFYGDTPGVYFGTGSSLGDSPIDAGNTATAVIGNLENGRLYYFTVAAYDSSPDQHMSDFSVEVSARPTKLRQNQ